MHAAWNSRDQHRTRISNEGKRKDVHVSDDGYDSQRIKLNVIKISRLGRTGKIAISSDWLAFQVSALPAARVAVCHGIV